MGGLLWAYLGPAPAPLLPRWDVFVMDNAFRQIGVATLDCNWLQCMENSVDPSHGTYLHGHYFHYVLQRQGEIGTAAERFRSRALRGQRRVAKVGFDVFEHGIMKRRLFEGQSEDEPDWRVGHPLVFPCMVRLGGDIRNELQIRVPIDDTHTWHVSYQCYDFGGRVEVPPQNPMPVFDVPTRDERGERLVDFTLAQDFAAWELQGPITNRSRERLGALDKGIALYRKLLRQQLDALAAGHDPMNVFRDPAANQRLDLPVAEVRPENQFGRSALHRGFAVDDIERYSPVLDQLVDLYAQAAEARGDDAAAG
jgi:5,5'-dehydrodivanillate O-demethylase